MLRSIRFLIPTLAVVATLFAGTSVRAADPAVGVEADAQAALAKLYSDSADAKALADQAVAILVFPNIVKAGFMVGAQYGAGVLLDNKGAVLGHYNSLAGSYGFQAGVQAYGYALFLMNQKAIDYLNRSDGWEIGIGPSIVILDKGKGKSLTTTTLKDDVYAFIFDQKGLMAGAGIQGSKITKTK